MGTVTKTLGTLALSLTSGCVTSPQPSLEHQSNIQPLPVEDDSLNRFYSLHYLFDDPQRLDALANFYSATLTSLDVEDPYRHLVLIEAFDRTPLGIPILAGGGHGYLIDDCGLVLTVNHITRRARSFRIWDQEGNIYDASLSDFFDFKNDYALLAAETHRPPSPHPLPIAPGFSAGTPLRFSTFFARLPHRTSYRTSGPYDECSFLPSSFFWEGEVLSLDQILEGVSRLDTTMTPERVTELVHNLEPCLDSSFFFSSTVCHGYSGTPVFDAGNRFLGIAHSYIPTPPFRALGGYGIAVHSQQIFDGLRNYLIDHGKL